MSKGSEKARITEQKNNSHGTQVARNVTLINPPIFHKEKKEEITKISDRYWNMLDKIGTQLGDREEEPNIGLLIVANHLRQSGYDLEYIDFHQEDMYLREEKGEKLEKEEIYNEIKNIENPIIGLSCLPVNYSITRKIAKTIKENNENSFIFLGGAYPTVASKEILREEPSIDVVVRREGEKTAVELLNKITKGEDISSINGITYRDENGDICENPPRELMDLESVEYPAYDLLHEKYHPLIYRVYTSRGCPYNCDFCFPSKFFGEKVRFLPPSKVVDQIEYLKKEYNASDFLIGDLTFFANSEHSKAVCQEIIDRDIDISWWCQTRVDLINKKRANLLREAGCEMVSVGIESSVQMIRNKMHKEFTNNQILRALRILKHEGITTQGYFIIGNVGETFENVFNTIKAIRELILEGLIDISCISVLVPYPGTEFFENAEDYGIEILDKNLDNYFMSVSRYCNPYPVYRTKQLSRMEIRGLWKLALATATKCHRMTYKGKKEEEKSIINILRGGEEEDSYLLEIKDIEAFVD